MLLTAFDDLNHIRRIAIVHCNHRLKRGDTRTPNRLHACRTIHRLSNQFRTVKLIRRRHIKARIERNAQPTKCLSGNPSSNLPRPLIPIHRTIETFSKEFRPPLPSDASNARQLTRIGMDNERRCPSLHDNPNMGKPLLPP